MDPVVVVHTLYFDCIASAVINTIGRHKVFFVMYLYVLLHLINIFYSFGVGPFEHTVAPVLMLFDLLIGLVIVGKALVEDSYHGGTDDYVHLVIGSDLYELVGVGLTRIYMFHHQPLSFQNVFPPGLISVVVSAAHFQFH